MSNVFNRGGIINERKINIKGCCKQLLDTYLTEKRNNINSISNYNCSADDTCRSKYQYRIRR